MKKIKKIMAMLLAMVMVLGMTVTASAAETDEEDDGIVGTSDDKGKITVSGIEAEENNENLKVTAYPIVKATYDEEKGNFTGYDVVYKKVQPAINLEIKDESGNIAITQAHLNAVIGALDDQNGKYNMTTNSDGNYTKTVPVGSYLVVVSGAEAKVYSPMVVSVNYVNQRGNNVIQGGRVDTITKIQNGNAWVKETNQPNFTKVENDVAGNKVGESEYGNSVNVGSKVKYTLTINPVPYYGGSHPVFNVVDTLDAGLTYDATSLKVQLVGSSENAQATTDLTADTDYTFTQDTSNSQELKVDFVVGDKYTLNDRVTAYTNCKIVITYTATLNKTANLTANTTQYGENVNTAVLNYTKDSKVSNNDVKGTIQEKTYTYSFDLDNFLTKTNEKGVVVEDLAGAKFGLYTDGGCTKAYKNTFNTSTEDPDKDGFYFTDESGKLSIKGLEAGTYYLKELEAPNGYSVNTHVFKIEIAATYAGAGEQGKDKGQLTSWTLKVDGEPVTVVEDKNPNGFAIKNTKLSSLPSTGGIGTTIFTIGGCAIMVAAAGLFFASRRKANK